MEKAENAQIPVETRATKILDLIWDIWQYQGPDVYKFIREKIQPIPKDYLLALFRIVLISFIPSIIFIGLGFSLNSRWLIFLGGIWRAGCTVLLLVALTPVGLLIEVARKGTEGSGQRWAETISGTFIGELFFTLIVMVLLSDMRARLDLMPILIMASMIMGMAGGATFGKKFIAPAAGAIFAVTIACYVFPGPVDAVIKKTTPFNALNHFEIDLKELEEGKTVFFDHNGSPKAWFYLDEKNRCLELFTREGYHPVANVKLKPLDERYVGLIIETKGRCLHPANIKKSGSHAESRSGSAAKIEQQKPPPEPDPPKNHPQIDLSKPWKFRWEKFPGYPGYEHGAYSRWVPAQIEPLDDSIKITLLGNSGGVIATFNGNRKSDGTFGGTWHMADQSGRGAFILTAVKSNSIEGSMQDETVDPRFIDIKLRARPSVHAEVQPRSKNITNRHARDSERAIGKKREVAKIPRPDSTKPKRIAEPKPAMVPLRF